MKIFLWAPKRTMDVLFPLEKPAGVFYQSANILQSTPCHLTFLYFYWFVHIVWLRQLEGELQESGNLSWFPLWHPQMPTMCLAHSRCSINICRTNKWRGAYLFKQVFMSELVVPHLPRWTPQKAGSSPWHLILLPLTHLVTMPRRCYILTVSRICPLASILCSPLPYIWSYHPSMFLDWFHLQSCLLQPSLQPATSVIF